MELIHSFAQFDNLKIQFIQLSPIFQKGVQLRTLQKKEEKGEGLCSPTKKVFVVVSPARPDLSKASSFDKLTIGVLEQLDICWSKDRGSKFGKSLSGCYEIVERVGIG